MFASVSLLQREKLQWVENAVEKISAELSDDVILMPRHFTRWSDSMCSTDAPRPLLVFWRDAEFMRGGNAIVAAVRT